MKTKKQIKMELNELRWSVDRAISGTRIVEESVNRIVNELSDVHTNEYGFIGCTYREMSLLEILQRIIRDAYDRHEQNKLRISELVKVNEMLIKLVEAMEQRMEKHECTNPFTGDDIRSGILNVCGGANDHYSDTVTAKPTDNATLTRVKVNMMEPESLKNALSTIGKKTHESVAEGLADMTPEYVKPKLDAIAAEDEADPGCYFGGGDDYVGGDDGGEE